MEWRHNGSPRPNIFRVQKSSENFSPRFFGFKAASSSLIIFQRAKLLTRGVTHLYWFNWRTFWRKNAGRGKVTKGVLFLHDNAPTHRALAAQKKLTYLSFPCLDHHPILRIPPRRTTTCSLDWKNKWNVAIFRPTRRSLLQRRPGWTDKLLIFLWLANLDQRAKKCFELRGVYLEKIPSLVAVACFLPGRAKDLSAPLCT